MHKRLVRVDVAITVGFLVVGATVILQAREWPFRAGLFPLVAGSVLFGLALLKIVLDLATAWRQAAFQQQGPVEDAEDATEEGEPADVFDTASRAEWLSALGWTTAFFVMLWVLGALVTVPLFALVYLRVASGESRMLAGIYALACWAFIYGLFDRVLHVPLPPGTLLAALGL